MPTLAIGERTLSYDEYGAGPTLVLVHGSPGNAKTWQRVADRLAERHRVLAPDLPGYGGSSPVPAGAPADNTHAAELVEALAATAGEPILLGGHSYGGVVSLAVALRGRAKVRAFALFEPVACPLLLAVGDADGFAVATTFAADYYARVERGEPRAAERMVALWFGEGAFDRMPPPVQAFLAANAASNAMDIRRTMSERYSLDALRALSIPVVVAYGSRSPALTLKIASALAANVGRGSLVRIDGATHALVTTHVDEVAGVMERLAAGGD